MDALLTAAARSLAAGDALGALRRVALRDDPPALALRGIAMAQLGEHVRARELLRRAGRAFGPREAVARARCVVAEAEVALAMRDLATPTRPLQQAAQLLDTHGDTANALQARLVATRRLLLLGRIDEAAAALPVPGGHGWPPLPAALAFLAAAELAWRSLRPADARLALGHALAAARSAGVPALVAEATDLLAMLDRPAARVSGGVANAGVDEGAGPGAGQGPGAVRLLRLDDVAVLLDSPALVVDACRRTVRAGGGAGHGDDGNGNGGTSLAVPLARRPVLFALSLALAEAWPGDVDRATLILRAFRTRHPDETHRARLRVELGRLRTLVAPLARIEATARGYTLVPVGARPVAVLLPPIDGEAAALQALLGDGARWSTSALALALGESQRNVQRALAELEAAGRVRALGQGRARRWLAPPLTRIATILLLPTIAPGG